MYFSVFPKTVETRNMNKGRERESLYEEIRWAKAPNTKCYYFSSTPGPHMAKGRNPCDLPADRDMFPHGTYVCTHRHAVKGGM